MYELIQREFLKFLCFRLDRFYPERGFSHLDLLTRFNFVSLKTRRIVTVVKILFNMLNNKVDVPQLLNKLNFKVPRINSRQSTIFYCSANRTNVLRKSPVNLMCDLCNGIAGVCDININPLKMLQNCIWKFMVLIK